MPGKRGKLWRLQRQSDGQLRQAGQARKAVATATPKRRPSATSRASAESRGDCNAKVRTSGDELGKRGNPWRLQRQSDGKVRQVSQARESVAIATPKRRPSATSQSSAESRGDCNVKAMASGDKPGKRGKPWRLQRQSDVHQRQAGQARKSVAIATPKRRPSATSRASTESR